MNEELVICNVDEKNQSVSMNIEKEGYFQELC